MQKTSDYYEGAALEAVANAGEHRDGNFVAEAQIYATLAHASAVLEAAETPRPAREEDQTLLARLAVVVIELTSRSNTVASSFASAAYATSAKLVQEVIESA